MFKLVQSDSYKYAVTVELPGGERYTFDVLFKRLPQAELEKLYKDLADGETTEDDLLARVLVGWDKVADENGEPLPFNDQNVARVFEVYPMRGTIATAWVDSLTSARIKNSPTPPASGRRG